mmetsp:Transcript_11411/g.13822  ORF Transcript_11411/g.13822 Transcript_11411/m.13822 type:complete len:160 (+) Transcript_11411:256-735(+)
MGYCPVPHTSREQFWLCVGVGITVSARLLYTYFQKSRGIKSKPQLVANPRKIEGLEDRQVLEYFGHYNMKSPDISVAMCSFSSSFTEGKKTILFDEYIIGLEGEVKVYDIKSKETYTCQGGQALYLPKGDYEFHFTENKPKYLAICAPAHHPELVAFHK